MPNYINEKSPDDFLINLLGQYTHILGLENLSSISFEQAINSICAYYEDIIGYMPGNVYWFDSNCLAVGCNKNVLNMFGFDSLADFKGLTFEDMQAIGNWSDEATKSFKNDTLEVLQNGKAKLNIEEPPMQMPNGEQRLFLTSRVPVLDKEGNIIGAVGISFDITERKKQEKELKIAKEQAESAKQAEEELRKMVMIFAGSIAHDLTTPLLNIKMMADNLNRFLPELLKVYQTADKINTNLQDNQLSYLSRMPETLQGIATELNQFVKDSLKALKKVTTGIISPDDLIQCELWKCLQKVLDDYPYNEGEKALIHWDSSCTFNFMGNPLMFYRILFNLIKNALYQINQQGKGEIFIRAELKDNQNMLYIKDTAGGVTQEIVDNIFTGYNSSKQDEGTGVGLSFCKLTMQSFGGDLQCRLVDGDCIEFVMMFNKINSVHSA